MKIFILFFVLLTAFLMNATPGYGQEDLKISLSASHVAANPGEEITYIINYSNAGLTAASNIIITDQLPASGLYTYVSSIPEGTISGNVITWNSAQIPDLTLLGAGQRQIYVTVKAGVVGNGITQASNGYYIPSESVILDNYATIKSMSTETLIQSDNVSTTVSQNCNVHINNASGMIKSATNTTVYYLMQITNNGNVYDRYDLSSLNYDCDGPATKDFDLLEAAFTDLGGNPITKTDWIGPNQTYFFHLQLKAGGGTNPGNLSCHDVIAKSLVSGYEGTGKIQTIIEGSLHIPLVSLSKIDTRDPVQAGEEFTYTIYAFNSNGAYPANDFVINETYPENITYIRSDPAPDMGYNNKWSLGTLGYGLNSAKTISITVQVNSSENCTGEIFNEVYASYEGSDSQNPPKASVTTTVKSYPDLSITKTAVTSSTPAEKGGSITYTLHYKNKGTCIAPDVRIKDIFDDVHTNITDAGGGIQTGNQITWDLGPLAPGEPGSKTYTVLIDPEAPFNPGTTSIPNTASISTTENESSYNNNVVSANVQVSVLPDLKVELSSANPIFEIGKENIYTLKVSNVGEIAAKNVVVKDLLPEGLTVGTISLGGINIDGIVTWPAIPILEAENSMEFTVTVIPSCLNFPSITNSANATSSIIDKNEDNNTATLTSAVKDLIKPILTDVPADETVSCDAIPAVGTPTATDNCDPVPVVHYLGEISNKGTDPLLPSYYNYSIIRKWEAVDASENHSDQMEQVITIQDITPPIAPLLTDVTGECAVSLEPPVAMDNCQSQVVGTTTTEFPITAQGTTVVTWTFDDGHNNVTTAHQNVIVDDITAPIADQQTLPTVTGECSVTVSAPTATDNCKGPIVGTTEDPTTYSIKGTYTIHWIYDDGNGNTSTQSQTVVVDDVTAPVADLAVLPTLTGQYILIVPFPTATDNCSGSVTGSTSDPLTYTEQGTYTVHWTYADGNGNTSTQTQTVVVEDTTAPDAPMLADIIVGECSGTPPLPTTTDNGSEQITGTTTTVFPITTQGTTIVTWTFEDDNGNVTTASQNVIVDDVTAPVADQQTLPTVTGECSVSVSAPTATDNCKGPIIGTTEDPTTYAAQGTYTIHWVYDDGNGNTSTQTQTVVVKDITLPEMPILADVIVGECSGTPPTPTTVDNCAGIVTGKTSIIFPKTKQGKSTIIWTFDDGNGNVTSAYQNLIVDDITAPVADQEALPTVMGECNVSVLAPTATDNCKGTIVGTTEDPTTYSIQGTYTIHWIYDDGNGNTSTQSQTVVVDDITPPEITGAIVALTVEGCDVATVTAPVTTVSELETMGITVSDACTADDALRVTSNDIHTGISPVMVTRTYTLTDTNDNSTTSSQLIRIVDSKKPTITLASPLASYPSDNGLCTYKVTGTQLDPLATADNCSVKSVTNNFNNSSSLKDATFPTGQTNVIWTVEDAGGNKTSASYDIIVVDTQNPQITCAKPSMSYSADPGVCSYKVPGNDLDPKITTDNCSVKAVINDFNKAGSLKDAIFPIGTTKVTWTIEDMNGNMTTCSAEIVVVDTQNPVIQCVEPTVDYAYQKPGKELDPIATDNCGVASIVNDFTNSASLQGAKFEPGTTVVKWTATDHSGNKSICSITIEVADILPPTITCAPVAATGYEANQGVCTYKVSGTAFDPAIEDNYSEVDIVNNYNHRASLNEAQFPVGETTVIWTATDKSGNSSTCTQIIKVNDTQKPTITAPANLSVKADAGKCTASALALGTPVTADNCSVASVTNDAPEIFPLGQTVVTWKVSDKSGNIATSAQTVVVERLLIAVDDAVSLKEDAQVSGNVLVNDAGLCNVPIQVKSHSEPAHGELTMADNGDFTYFPDENYHGADKFTYQICSSQGECSEATVTITVESVNDLPIATEDKQTIQLDLVLKGDVADNDRMSGDGVNVWTMVDQPAHGTILFHPDGTYTYTPNADFLGSDSFTYKLCDTDGDCSQAKVSIRIEDVLLPNQILTPNGDDVNDTFIIVGIDLYPQNKLTMYNRWGNVVYQKNNYQNEWDGNSNVGKIGSKSLPVGTYYYLIDYGKGRHKTGFVYLDR